MQDKRIPAMVKKIKTIEEAIITKINQPISVSELFVKFKKGLAEGESKFKQDHVDKRSRVTRLVDHIAILGRLTEQYHEANYFTGSQIRLDSINKITRLSLNEFALYTRSSPLSEEEFHELTANIEKNAAKLHTNVHLVLGTVAVGSHEKLRNISIYVQGGLLPKMHYITKSYPSDSDIAYAGYKFSGRVSKKSRDKEHTKTEEAIAIALSSGKESAVAFNPIFMAETEGGAEVVVGVDICLDHLKAHAKKAFEDQINATVKHKDFTSYFPRQRSQVVVSNAISVYEEKSFSHMVMHADPGAEGGLHSRWQKRGRLANLDKDNFKRYVGLFSKVAKIHVDAFGVSVSAPPFGSSYTVEAYVEHNLTLGKEVDPDLENRFDRLIAQANVAVMLRRMDAVLKDQGLEVGERRGKKAKSCS